MPGGILEGMTTKQAIHEIVERLSEEEAAQLLAYLRDEEPEEYPEELLERIAQAKAEIARGDFVTMEQLEKELGL